MIRALKEVNLYEAKVIQDNKNLHQLNTTTLDKNVKDVRQARLAVFITFERFRWGHSFVVWYYPLVLHSVEIFNLALKVVSYRLFFEHRLECTHHDDKFAQKYLLQNIQSETSHMSFGILSDHCFSVFPVYNFFHEKLMITLLESVLNVFFCY